MQRAFSTVNEPGPDEATLIGDLKLVTAIQHKFKGNVARPRVQ